MWSEESTDKEKLTDKDESTDIPPMPPLDDDKEEVKEEKGLKILTPNKLLTCFLILLAQIKAGNNSQKLKKEINKYCIFCISIIKLLNKFTKSYNHYNHGRDPKTFCFNYDWSEDVDENLKHEI